jgi:hypothetical protein
MSAYVLTWVCASDGCNSSSSIFVLLQWEDVGVSGTLYVHLEDVIIPVVGQYADGCVFRHVDHNSKWGLGFVVVLSHLTKSKVDGPPSSLLGHVWEDVIGLDGKLGGYLLVMIYLPARSAVKHTLD